MMSPENHRQLVSYVGSWRGARANPDSLIIGRNEEGARAPIFWVFQGEHELQQLAKELGKDQPLFGMRSGHLAIEYSEDNIQAIALDYAREIEALRPNGPLILGGNCQGSVVALAIAQHLIRRRRHLPLLILMEWNIEPQPYAGPVGLIFGRESELAYPYMRFWEPELMWKRAWPDHFVEYVSGGHGEYFSAPNIRSLAKAVNALIDASSAVPLRLMPEEAWRYELKTTALPACMRANEQRSLQIDVKNISDINWPDGAKFGLALRNIWLKEDGTAECQKDGQTFLPELPSGAGTKLSMKIRAPAKTGTFRLVFLISEEGVPWHEQPESSVEFSINVLSP